MMLNRITGETNFPKYIEIKECPKCGSKNLFVVTSLCSVYYDVKNGKIVRSNVYIDTGSSFDYEDGTSLHCKNCKYSQNLEYEQAKEEK